MNFQSTFLKLWLCAWVFACGALLCLADEAATGIPSRGSASNSERVEATSEEVVLRFRNEPRCQAQVVRVGDLVEVVNAGRATHDALLDVPLAPAPQIGAAQTWTARDVLRHLELRGLMKSRIRWSGDEVTKLFRVAEADVTLEPNQVAPAFVQDRTLAQAEANVIQATREYLWMRTGERTPWRVSVQVPSEHASALSQRRNIETIGGGEAPWVGEQQLQIGYKHSGKSFHVALPVTIELPPTIVVTTRPMRRDEVIEASALAYAPLPERIEEQAGEYFTDFNQIVGKQLRRSMSTGQPVPQSAIGEPIVISSGELIEVESVAGAISVKTAGRALSGGAVGELINIELLSSRKRLAATVVGPLQARIAGGASLSSSQASSASTRAAGAPSSPTRNASSRSRTTSGIASASAGLSQNGLTR